LRREEIKNEDAATLLQAISRDKNGRNNAQINSSKPPHERGCEGLEETDNSTERQQRSTVRPALKARERKNRGWEHGNVQLGKIRYGSRLTEKTRLCS